MNRDKIFKEACFPDIKELCFAAGMGGIACMSAIPEGVYAASPLKTVGIALAYGAMFGVSTQVGKFFGGLTAQFSASASSTNDNLRMRLMVGTLVGAAIGGGWQIHNFNENMAQRDASIQLKQDAQTIPEWITHTTPPPTPVN